jgi:hypothetical protein
MTDPLATLLQTALVGTGRQEPAVPAIHGAIGELLQQLAQGADGAPERLLRMAGAVWLCGQAGYVAAPSETTTEPRAPKEGRPAHDSNLNARVLKPLLAEGPERLQFEAFTRLDAAGLRLAPALLPAALEAGRRSVAIRPPLARVLGARGHWLASLNPAWAYAAGGTAGSSAQEQWDHGNLEQRRAAFTAMRQQDASQAREKLAAELAQLNARERAEFVGLMREGLAPKDEAFLDGLLKDRSKEVRQAGAALLMRLPESRHGQAVAAALAPLVRAERGILGRRLYVEAPTAAEPGWRDEGLDAARPQHESLGERAWWLYQLVRNAPLGWWPKHCEMDLPTLLQATAKSEWKEALRRGWRDAVLATGDPSWARALLADWDKKTLGPDHAEVLGVLPLSEREQHWERALTDSSSGVAGVIPTLLQACPPGHTLSPAFSQRMAVAMAREWAPATNHSLRYYIADALCLLDLAALDPVLAAVRRGDPGDAAAQAERIITARRALAQLAIPFSQAPTAP